MRSHTYNILRAKNIEFTFRIDEGLENQKLSLEDRRHFYLIFKEILNNMIKYSEATKASIILKFENNHISLLIRDNGKGFDTSASANGNGLNNMKRRAKEMHANITIETSPGNGTTIELKI
jgi:signal transduction histidine kinase